MSIRQLERVVARFWNESVLEPLRRYICVPAVSKEFDPDWVVHHHIAQVAELARAWVCDHVPDDAEIELINDLFDDQGKPRAPLLFVEIPVTDVSAETVLLYGHPDKQPPFEGWDKSRGLEPWKPVDITDGESHRLYGRGGADDGYAVFAAVSAINALDELRIPRARCVFLIETGEESGSPDLPFYLKYLRWHIGTPSLIVALDSGCGTYDRLWLTTTLRGLVLGVLDVEVLTEGVHSGDATGIVPDSFRMGSSLIARLEDVHNGEILVHGLHADIPYAVQVQAQVAAEAMGFQNVSRFPWVEEVRPRSTDKDQQWLVDMILARTWAPGLTVTGIDGMPSVKDGGNVRRPGTRFKLSIRIPPSVDAQEAARVVESAIMSTACTEPAKVTFNAQGHAGWVAPAEAEWLTRAVDSASMDVFSKEAVRMGEGGSIPFMGQLSRAYPNAQFVITGVLGPGSNAHGPNEFLDVGYAKRLSAAVAHILASHQRHFDQH